ncbi:MAG TPA: HAD family hydrolase [Myxococcota bacterium]
MKVSRTVPATQALATSIEPQPVQKLVDEAALIDAIDGASSSGPLGKPVAGGTSARSAYWTTDVPARSYGEIQAVARALVGAPGAAASKAVGLALLPSRQAGSSDVIRALAQADLSSLRQAGVRTVATLDFDNTLVPGDTFVAFCDHLAKHLVDVGRVDDGTALARSVAEHVSGALPAKDMLRIGIASFTGFTVDELSTLARAMFTSYIGNAFDHGADNSARSLVRELTDAGIEPFVVSAGMRFLGQVGAELLGIPRDNAFGGELAVDDTGRCTGALALDVASIGKAAVIKDQIGTPPVFAFGDSPGSDAPMLAEAIVQGFMINPSEKFLLKAKDESLPYVAMVWRAPA